MRRLGIKSQKSICLKPTVLEVWGTSISYIIFWKVLHTKLYLGKNYSNFLDL